MVKRPLEATDCRSRANNEAFRPGPALIDCIGASECAKHSELPNGLRELG